MPQTGSAVATVASDSASAPISLWRSKTSLTGTPCRTSIRSGEWPPLTVTVTSCTPLRSSARVASFAPEEEPPQAHAQQGSGHHDDDDIGDAHRDGPPSRATWATKGPGLRAGNAICSGQTSYGQPSARRTAGPSSSPTWSRLTQPAAPWAMATER